MLYVPTHPPLKLTSLFPLCMLIIMKPSQVRTFVFALTVATCTLLKQCSQSSLPSQIIAKLEWTHYQSNTLGLGLRMSFPIAWPEFEI